MSLINNMLKDLEKRNSTYVDVPNISLLKNEKKILLNKSLLNINKYLLFILFTFILIASFLIPQNKNAILASMLGNDETPSAIKFSKEMPIQSIIQGIAVKHENEITEISLILDRSTLYRINHDVTGNQLSLIIEHAKLDADMPSTSSLGSSIIKISSQKSKDDTILNLFLAPSATIRSISLLNENTQPEVLITIDSNRTHLDKVRINASVKTPATQTLLLERYKDALVDAESGNSQSAISGLSAILGIDPEFKDARVSLSALLIDQGKTKQANLILNDGIRLNGTYVPYIELKARILLLGGDSKGALELLQSVSPPLNSHPGYYSFLAALYEQLNYDSLAIQIYKKLLASDTHNSNWWYGLGVSSEKIGNKTQAHNAFKHALEQGHLSSDAISYIQGHSNMRETEDGTA